MESRAEKRNVQEESTTHIAEYPKRGSFATTDGQNYEVALCCLLFLRALRHAGDFFLASNHDDAGTFDDVVLFYRLKGDQGHLYRAILLQAKHRETVTQKKLTLSNPFKLDGYLNSFKTIRHHWEDPLKVDNCEIQFQEIMLILYTNTGCVIGDAACHVPDFPEVQHLQDFLNTGGRLLRISEARRVGLPEGEETSDFLAHLLLCTEQANVETVDTFLEQELCNLFKLSSPDKARKLNTELKCVVKAWWSKHGTAHYLTTESDEWKRILEMQVRCLNMDSLNTNRQFNVEFTNKALREFDVVGRCLKLSWICVTDEYQAYYVRSRLFKARRNSLVVSVKYLENHLEEFEALWRNNICPTLVLDMSKDSLEEGLPMLQRLQEAVSSDVGRHLVVIAKGKPVTGDWSEIVAGQTWSVLHWATRDRLLKTKVNFQGKIVTLRDVASYVKTDEVIDSLCECQTEMKLASTMPAPLEYFVPRCLERTPFEKLDVGRLGTNIIIFHPSFVVPEMEVTKRFKILQKDKTNTIAAIKCPTIVTGIRNDYDIRQLCCRFRVQGVSGELSMEGFQGNLSEYIPFTWICKENIVVIQGLPGVGKSSYVTMMCSTVKEQFPKAWVLRLDMGRHTDYIKEADFTEVSDFKELLLKSLHKDASNLERQLLEDALTVTGNVFLFLDAFDEISPDYTTKCCDLLKGIVQKLRFRQMVVTTRPVTTRDVQEALQTKAFTLPVFSVEEQVIFLKQFSASKDDFIDEEEFSYVRNSAGPVLETPLLCRMAAEVLLHRNGERLFKYLNPWRRVLLYDVFVEQSVKEGVAEKFRLDASMPGVNVLLESNKNMHVQNLQGLAVRKLIPADQVPPLSVSTVTPEEKLGLVVDTGGSVDFEHQTFAEYFLGQWLACHWRHCPRQLLRDVLLKDGFQFVAATFSWSLFEGFPLHMAVARGDEDGVRQHLSAATTDRGGRSALHAAAMSQGDHRDVWQLLVASGEDLNRNDDILDTSAIKYAECSANWEFIDLCLGHGANLGDIKLVTVQEEAKNVHTYAVKKDLVSLCQFIWRRHPNIFRNESPAHMAAANNSKYVIKLLIRMGHIINEVDETGLTPLHEASKLGHVEAVTLLMESGADVNTQANGGCGFTALTWAGRGGHREVAKILLQNGADVNIVNKYGDTALMEAAREGHLDVVKILLENGADLNMRSNYGYTALMLAAAKGHLEVVKILLENGTDLNKTTTGGFTYLTWVGCHTNLRKMLLERNYLNFGNTALMCAAYGGHLEVVKLLLENGADLNVKTPDGYTALTWAAYGGQSEVAKILLDNAAHLNYGNKALLEAAREGHPEMVKMLLENGVDVNIKSEDGKTALMEGICRDHPEVVMILLENGADVNIKSENDITALMWAAYGGHVEVVKMLLEKGVDVNIEYEYGTVLIGAAALRGHLEVVKVLLENGADVNTMNKYGDTALMNAASEDHLDVVKMLLENGANVNIINTNGGTALMEAARRGHLDVVKKLLENGADVNAKNSQGLSALMLADTECHMEVVRFLTGLN